MAKKQEILKELALWVAETVDIAKIIATHNKGLPQEDPAYVIPIDNKTSFGKLTEVSSSKKGGYGTQVIVNQSTKRDAVMAKIWEKMSAKNMMERIEEKYIETFKENGITVTVDTFALSRFANFSSGSKTIFLSLQEYNDDGTKKTSKDKLVDPTKAFVIFAKALRTVQGDPHELMSGILIATNKIYDENSINGLSLEKRNKKLEEICQEIFDNRKKVDGYKEKEAKLIEGDIVNLAKALSISNYINKLLRRNSASNVEVYQTGAKWSKNIAKFKGKDKSRDTIIKSYNSSDLIIKFNLGKATHHWGLSLKKKGYKVNEVDPTLLNKPIVGDAGGKKTAGFLFLKASNTEIDKLKNAEDNFFKAVYRVRFGEEPKTNNASWKKKLNDGLAGDEKKAALTGKEYRGKKYPQNTFFKEIDRVFRDVMKDDNNFKELLDLIFRLDIDEYVNQENFHFSLITGIGGLEPNGKIKINEPNEKNSVFLKQVFTSMFQGKKVSNIAKFDGNFRMLTTKGKFQAFDTLNATAAKLFYTMFIDSLPVVDLEVRYKGSITAKPQLQVFITRRFNNFLKSAQRKMQNLGVHAYLK